MLALLRQRLPEVLKAIAPLVALGCVLQVAVVHAPLALFLQFLAGSLFVVAGMLLHAARASSVPASRAADDATAGRLARVVSLEVPPG